MLIKCDYCRQRFREQQRPLHEKHCIYRRRALKREQGKAVVVEETQPEPLQAIEEVVEVVVEKKPKHKKVKK